ncbi:MAG: N-formylglutamate deformylase [Micavibrio aeruginosavorus]|uniref:N-formylglutamate deformylase n=1 Tax=Micavibrio aeruginosavorus TaxID=349221 RepID=A0A7T5R0P4_9BACT|nr:MAG: N-formylglutamate deformylase [Micavibrio aeruginosavorus]
MNVFSLTEGRSPLIISIPHAGTYVPDEIRACLTPAALRFPDTDWHIPRLYDFATDMGATVISANYSRYVIDLNRPPDNAALYPGQTKVPLCPDETFEGEEIYLEGLAPDEGEVSRRLVSYWQPYHDQLERQIDRIKQAHGYAILYDAHSIKGELPRLFEGRLPDMNLGTARGYSCCPALEQAAYKVMQGCSYSAVLNGRFIGGYITRHYGDPVQDVHALQMELVRENYMNEDDFSFAEDCAVNLRIALRSVLQSLLDWGIATYKPLRTTA